MDVDHPSWCLPDERWRRPPWWLQESDVDPIQSVHTSNVNLDCLNGDPLADQHAGSGRRRVRARVPCVICARLGWDREYAHFWAQTKESGRTSVFGDAFTETPATSAPPLATSPVRSSAGSTVAATEVDAASSRDARERLWTFLDPNRYRRRWSFKAPDGEADGGIPLEELEASSVRDPRTKKCGFSTRKCLGWSPWMMATVTRWKLRTRTSRFPSAVTVSLQYVVNGLKCRSSLWLMICSSGNCQSRFVASAKVLGSCWPSPALSFIE